MSKLILFSNPSARIWEMLRREVGISDGMKLAYMPSDGANEKIKYREKWQNWVEQHGGRFVVVNNSFRGDQAEIEVSKLLDADILVITGGNTFVLLNHLRESGLDRAVVEFSKSENKVILGFSAGAIIMSPTIKMANCGDIDNNEVGMTDFTGLNLIPFDIFPHYKEEYASLIKGYEELSGQSVQRLTDDDFLIISTED